MSDEIYKVVQEEDNAAGKYKFILESFPDVDESFLQSAITDYGADDRIFQSFIEKTMLQGLYPRKTGAGTTRKTGDTTILDPVLLSFIEKYPDPLKYFSTETPHNSQTCRYRKEYLVMKHRKKSMKHIEDVMKKHQHNLFLSDMELSNAADSRLTPRCRREMFNIEETPNPSLKDIVFFIENKNSIQEIIANRNLAREKLVEEARLANNLFECGCCFSDDLLAEEIHNCSEGHIFCKACILKSTEVNLGEGKLTFSCLQECGGFFDMAVLKEILPGASYSKLERKIQAKEVTSANISGLESCPFCEYSAILSEGSIVFNCENCKKPSCTSCKKESHIPLKCSEVDDQETKDRTFVEEKMTEALLRNCEVCGRKFIRIEGCNKIKCICNNVMCYICKKQIKGYDHFSSEENVPMGKCPLWTNANQQHAREVTEQRERAIEDVKRKNPFFDDRTFNDKKRKY